MFRQSSRRLLTASSMALLLMGLASSAWAYVVDGSGRIVDSLGHEWLNAADVTGFTWAQFDSVCFHEGEAGTRTPCTGPAGGGGFDLKGWTWAFASEVGTLFQEVASQNGCVGCTSSAPVHQNGSAWANQSVLDLGATGFFSGFLVNARGWAGTPEQDPFVGDDPVLEYDYNGSLNNPVASSYDPRNASAEFSGVFNGGWFFRSAPSVVPEPTVLALAIASLAALAAVRRRRKT